MLSASIGRPYHPRKCVIADLFKVSVSTRILCLASDIAVDPRKPALLQIFCRTFTGLVPQGRRESYSFFVNGEGLESKVDI